MSEDPLKALSDQATEAHTKIQQAYQHINPVVAVRRGLRDVGFPADVMTIDCLRTRRRIMLILHDKEPGMLLYQFAGLDEEASEEFQRKVLTEVCVDTLFGWIQDYFSDAPTQESE
ncbi:hypothetical protein [Gilvimarinus sp. 1_MG-2023]|uniref:hypothetical protein n=1 Tax=Gilvimarinus sp. 1_MG-2023 TaxID=3062638 RepID=UPI0026E27210|nr:hypothetical protein [Gilvimarinus sp. 1_MG-2023]MDO6748297.1 hypothetical protein [Gilvimarinus sp. 1_MG-2023]